jgi:hypothetical protein
MTSSMFKVETSAKRPNAAGVLSKCMGPIMEQID